MKEVGRPKTADGVSADAPPGDQPVSSLIGCAPENFWNLFNKTVALLRIRHVLGLLVPDVLRQNRCQRRRADEAA